jgi:tellurite methyltransferase
MSSADRERWNQRYREGDHHTQADAWLDAHAHILRAPQAGARALDLACGSGRHTLWLAELGYSVDAWDISDVGLELLHAELKRRREAGATLPVTTRQVDLETVTIPAQNYDLILDAFFLERRLFPEMIAGVRPRGLLVVRTLLHRTANEDRNPAHLLAPGELSTRFSDLQILQLEEDPEAGHAGIIARNDART